METVGQQSTVTASTDRQREIEMRGDIKGKSERGEDVCGRDRERGREEKEVETYKSLALRKLPPVDCVSFLI